MWSSSSFGQRVGIGFVIVIVVLTASVAMSLWRLSERVNQQRVPLVRAGLNLQSSVKQSIASFRGILIYGDERSGRKKVFAIPPAAAEFDVLNGAA